MAIHRIHRFPQLPLALDLELHEQISRARVDRKWTLGRLISAADLELSEESLSRKLAGLQKLSTYEAQQLADALDLTLVYRPQGRTQQGRTQRRELRAA